jgi:hypothetical protein
LGWKTSAAKPQQQATNKDFEREDERRRRIELMVCVSLEWSQTKAAVRESQIRGERTRPDIWATNTEVMHEAEKIRAANRPKKKQQDGGSKDEKDNKMAEE